jgi:hypothetical protein
MRRLLAFVTAAAAVLGPAPAGAQDAGDFADALEEEGVVYEDEALDSGFLTDDDLAGLESLVDDLDSSEASFDVAVLGSAVTDAPSEQAFAEDVLDGLAGDGRVVVLSPAAIGVASDLDSAAEVERAAEEAERAADDEQSLTAGVEAAAAALGMETAAVGGSSDADGDDGGGGSAWTWVLVAVVVIAVIGGLFWWSSRRRRRAVAATEAAHVGEGERKVRERVEHASQMIVELAQGIDLAGTPVDAQTAFREGAAAFAELQEELDAADTRPELEAVWPRLVRATWQLDVAKALSQGQPAPAEPAPGPLFPPAVQPGPAPDSGDRIPVPDLGAAPPPPAHYQQYDQSPFRGDSFGKALGILVGMGMLNQTLRRPSDPGWFEEQERRGGGFWDGSMGRRSGSSRRSGGRRISYGRSGSRSMGRRRR